MTEYLEIITSVCRHHEIMETYETVKRCTVTLLHVISLNGVAMETSWFDIIVKNKTTYT